ncbi:hypothetical protein F5888DRAFT_541104 [Russula emetica]|nr:hypothetical protein F5888DRAFT_541104 [Russula emetica]
MCLQCLCAGFPGLPHTHDQYLDPPSEGHYDDTHHDAPLQAHHAARWGGTNSQNVLEERVDHLEFRGASCSSDPPGPSSTTNADTSFSPFGALCSQSGAQDHYPHATLSPHEHAEVAAQSPVVTQGQSATSQASQQRAQKAREKREKDRARKRTQRFMSAQDHENICNLLNIPLKPKNTVAHRILEGVETMAERQKVDNDLQRQPSRKRGPHTSPANEAG